MPSTSQLSGKTQEVNVPVQQNSSTGVSNIRTMLVKHGGEITKALPGHMNAERLGRIAMTEIRKNPKLIDASPESLFGSIIQCAQLGLEPGGALGHVYLVPYGRDVQVQIGYRGMIELGYRSGYLNMIYASVVYEADEFAVVLGTSPAITHVPALKPESEKGKITFFYAVADTKGGKQFSYMSIEDICRIRDGGRFQNPIWEKHFVEMGKKTVIRRLFKILPMSSERCERALDLDNQIGEGVSQHNETLLDPQEDEIFMGSIEKDDAPKKS